MGDDHVEFNFFKTSQFPSIFDECNRIDRIDNLAWEEVINQVFNGPLEHFVLNDCTIEDKNLMVATCDQFLKVSS